MKLHELISAKGQVTSLQPGDVHVWRLSTELLPEDLRELELLLSVEEEARAARFYWERDRRRYVVCRACLRLLSAAYSGRKAAQIRFRYGPQGKPALSDSDSPTDKSEDKLKGIADLRFNISHSGDLALFAFSIAREVGVDVEWMRPDLDFVSLAQFSFSPAEQDSLATSPPEERASLFYELWSCKEACIKADGRGVSAGLDQFTVVRAPDRTWRRIAVSSSGSLSAEMRVRILDVGAGYASAVAAPSGGWDVALLHIS